MRAVILAAVVAAGIGFIGTQTASAAPANGVTINEAATVNTAVVQKAHWRGRSRWWGRRGCHWRWRSGWRC
ncbi:MAG TPA: hypothetical protein VGF02_06610 [Pseudolabrys sp.]|jgi:hypothetical protein